MSNAGDLILIATTTFGLEAVVREEIKKLGVRDSKIEVKNGRVEFPANKKLLCEANIWLRCAERVLLKVGEFHAHDFDQLYDGIKDLPWSRWLPENARFPVSATSVKSQLHSEPACQSVAKKAIVDNLAKKYGKEWFDEDGPLYQINLKLHKDQALLTIDTSGDGLHKRGYRELSTSAPLQETIAAGMIYLSRWHKDRNLIDPFCGSGTIPIEAALLGKNKAPGLERKFAAEKWPNISNEMWLEVREKAREEIIRDGEPRLIMGTDRDKNVIGIARHHAQKAGVNDWIHLQKKDFSNFSTSRKYGYIICNPPYGERLSKRSEVEKLYKMMGEKFSELSTWSFYILTSHPKFEKIFGEKASKRRKLYNGGIECHYYQYYGPYPPA